MRVIAHDITLLPTQCCTKCHSSQGVKGSINNLSSVQFTLLWYTKYNKYFEISQYGDSMACESIIHIDTLTHSLVAFCHLQTDIDNTIYYNPVKKTIVFSIY